MLATATAPVHHRARRRDGGTAGEADGDVVRKRGIVAYLLPVAAPDGLVMLLDRLVTYVILRFGHDPYAL